MSPEKTPPGHDDLGATELTLGLPGAVKRGFEETVDLKLRESAGPDDKIYESKPKAQVVGWPPVRACRKKMATCCRYVKVAVDGAPYLRKVDLEAYNSYQQLLSALEDMLSCLTIRNYLNDKKSVEEGSGVEYVATYEDSDGDWMLLGDVPWKMFVESCKRLRLMKITDALCLAPKTPPRC